MRAVVWHGPRDVRFERLLDTEIPEPTRAPARRGHAMFRAQDAGAIKVVLRPVPG